jgi:hypothetical protein
VQGFGQAHADLVNVSSDATYITRKDAPVNGKVGLVSGGGSGHEPLHAGFVGRGMLDAAVPGAVFTSPTPDQILPATLAVNSGAGVVHIVKNYTGDVLNFETAAELSEAEGVNVRTVLVNDDVAVEEPLELRFGGKAATVLMRTPGHDEELIRGFLLSEGLIAAAEGVVRLERPRGLAPDERGNVVDVELFPSPDRPALDRPLYSSSSCGTCGKRSLASLEVPPIPWFTATTFKVLLDSASSFPASEYWL